jgi:hypothetical protein
MLAKMGEGSKRKIFTHSRLSPRERECFRGAKADIKNPSKKLANFQEFVGVFC